MAMCSLYEKFENISGCSHEMQARCNFCIATTYLPAENQVNNQAESNRIFGQFI